MYTQALGVLFAAIGTYVSLQAAATPFPQVTLLWAIGFVTFSISTFLIKLHPHLIILAVITWAISWAWGVPDQVAKFLCTLGALAGVAGIAVVGLSLFKRPIHTEVEIEDRTDFSPPEPVVRTPQELLAIPWSTFDKHCDWPVASLMLELSRIAYLPPVDAREQLQQKGFARSESVNDGSMQGYVINAGSDAIITLRGTEHKYDFAQDVLFLRARSEHGAMHGGFYNGYSPIHEQVTKLLALYKPKRIWITGHSLGGGLAIACAYNLVKDSIYPIAGVMTFGQPMVVRENLASYLGDPLDGKYVFFVNDMDPIPRLIEPYQHFGHMVRWNDNDIERSEKVTFGSSPDETDSHSYANEVGYVEPLTEEELETLLLSLHEDSTLPLSEDGRPQFGGVNPTVQDHYLESYRQMLESLRTHSTLPH